MNIVPNVAHNDTLRVTDTTRLRVDLSGVNARYVLEHCFSGTWETAYNMGKPIGFYDQGLASRYARAYASMQGAM